MTDDSSEQKPTHAERVRPSRTNPKLTRDQKDALAWLECEVANVTKEAELRIKDATEFVTEYAQRRMSPEEFKQRDSAYMFRWSDPLRGIADSRGASDEEILREIDARREKRQEDYNARHSR